MPQTAGSRSINERRSGVGERWSSHSDGNRAQDEAHNLHSHDPDRTGGEEGRSDHHPSIDQRNSAGTLATA